MCVTIGVPYTPESVFAASNVTSFSWQYYLSSVDGRSQGVFHKLGSGTAQLKVNKCNNYSSSKKATVLLRKATSSYPYYRNCGDLSFYSKGTYTFGKVSSGSYWLHASGGKSDCYKTAEGKVQNK